LKGLLKEIKRTPKDLTSKIFFWERTEKNDSNRSSKSFQSFRDANYLPHAADLIDLSNLFVMPIISLTPNYLPRAAYLVNLSNLFVMPIISLTLLVFAGVSANTPTPNCPRVSLPLIPAWKSSLMCVPACPLHVCVLSPGVCAWASRVAC
jgi:hypothetical protein